ncbi:AMP-binding protein [Xanthomonas sp. MUS 060]|uniref:AMP-binding protein n=1 Tax=Xanthomonas sp. MUS 060 TaxID=1588031 RepID=UPI000698AA85|nr:AMP-binding protein [Xanthomonas sp. MUS 060]
MVLKISLLDVCLPLLDDAERHQLLMEWNATTKDYPRDACVHELFEAQVARTPSAIAVVQGEVALTYGELNARANRLAHYLRELGVCPDDRVAILPLLDDAERHQLLMEWNATTKDYPRDACVHELFEAQVARTPSAIAVVQGEVALTYGELNARANRLAHYLRELGVCPDDRVAICMRACSAVWRWWSRCWRC